MKTLFAVPSMFLVVAVTACSGTPAESDTVTRASLSAASVTAKPATFAGTGKTFFSAPGCSPHAPTYSLIVATDQLSMTEATGTGEGGKHVISLALTGSHDITTVASDPHAAAFPTAAEVLSASDLAAHPAYTTALDKMLSDVKAMMAPSPCSTAHPELQDVAAYLQQLRDAS